MWQTIWHAGQKGPELNLEEKTLQTISILVLLKQAVHPTGLFDEAALAKRPRKAN